MRSAAFIFAFALAWLSTVAADDPATSATLTITVDNVRNSKGVVGVLVFRSPQGWPEKVDRAIRSVAVPAQPGPTTLALDDLPSGTYAVVALHDENENMKLDKSFFGIPKEGWGMSNNPKARASAPSFSRARFLLERETRLKIHLNY
jgi:uncharacterized protein (DUF2141 family)